MRHVLVILSAARRVRWILPSAGRGHELKDKALCRTLVHRSCPENERRTSGWIALGTIVEHSMLCTVEKMLAYGVHSGLAARCCPMAYDSTALRQYTMHMRSNTTGHGAARALRLQASSLAPKARRWRDEAGCRQAHGNRKLATLHIAHFQICRRAVGSHRGSRDD